MDGKLLNIYTCRTFFRQKVCIEEADACDCCIDVFSSRLIILGHAYL